jgi:hypothetical protein
VQTIVVCETFDEDAGWPPPCELFWPATFWLSWSSKSWVVSGVFPDRQMLGFCEQKVVNVTRKIFAYFVCKISISEQKLVDISPWFPQDLEVDKKCKRFSIFV